MEKSVIFDFDVENMPIEKDAKIFEAGEYPDKGIAVGEDDLDAIVRNFTEAPVKVEHTDSPLDPLGKVKSIWRKGRELYAKLAFPSDLSAFLDRRGVKKLSVALYKDPLRLAEVSLVLSPRVPTAAMFGQENNQREVSENMSEKERDSEIANLRFALRKKDVETQIARLKADGKIVPASERLASEILLRAEEKITFGDEEMTVARLFEKFLDLQPKVAEFGELAPGIESSDVPLSSAEQEIISKLGITKEQFEKYGK